MERERKISRQGSRRTRKNRQAERQTQNVDRLSCNCCRNCPNFFLPWWHRSVVFDALLWRVSVFHYSERIIAHSQKGLSTCCSWADCEDSKHASVKTELILIWRFSLTNFKAQTLPINSQKQTKVQRLWFQNYFHFIRLSRGAGSCHTEKSDKNRVQAAKKDVRIIRETGAETERGSVLKDAIVCFVRMMRWSRHTEMLSRWPVGKTLLLCFTRSVYQRNKTSPLGCVCGSAC